MLVFVTGDNTRTDLRIGLFPSGISSKCFFTGVDFVGVDLLIVPCIDSWTNEYSDLKFRILRAQGLQTRLEYSSHFTTSIPTFWQTCAKTSPLQSFLLDGLKRFSVEIWLDFKLPNLTLKLQLQSLHRSLGFIDIYFPPVTYFDKSLFWLNTCPRKFTSVTKDRRFYWSIYDSR